MIGIGLAIALTVHAQSNRPYISGYEETANFTLLQESTLFNTPGYPIEPIQAKPVIKKTVAAAFDPCSCVSYARYKSGISFGPIYMAKNLVPNSGPAVGGIVITYESWAGHLAVITAIEGDYLVLSESNYSRCRVTEGRRLNINSSVIKGYFN